VSEDRDRPGDGRGIDPSLESEPTYYGLPVIKEPVWIWAVPAYFAVGGAAGAAAVLGAAADAAGREAGGLVRRARWIAAAGGALGTGLLIYDLGRPERFLNMLRVFRPTSPLNVGSWVLAAFAPAAAASVLADAPGVLRRVGRAGAVGAGVLGLPMAGYTAVLLANTAVPLWQQGRRVLPPLFVASAASAAAGLLEATRLDDQERRIVRRFGLAAKAVELGSMHALERELGAVDSLGRPLVEGVSALLWRSAKVLTALSLAVSLLPRGGRRTRSISALTAVGGSTAVKFAVFHAGRASARDPRATFVQQRSGHGAAEVAGIARPRDFS
jgi:formate-dependent nitrite reductase membrane component NrfD